MGQRLVIQNKINGESVNAIYYHWSAYTESSISELKDFADHLLKNYKNRSTEFLSQLTDKGKELLKKLDNCELTNTEIIELFNLMSYFAVSGVSSSGEESLNYLSQFTTDTNRETVNRNYGLLGITSKDQDSLLYWSEGTLVVDWAFTNQGYPDFERTVFDFSHLFCIINEDEYNEYYNEDGDNPISSLEKCPYSTRNVPLSNISQIQDNLNQHPHILIDEDNEILTFIE